MKSDDLVHKLCEYLNRFFPELEIKHFDASDFFRNSFDPEGLPDYQDDQLPVWKEPGLLISLKAKGIFHWNKSSCDFSSNNALNSDLSQILLFYLYDDARIGLVNESDGTTSIIGKTLRLEQIADIFQLFFKEGRYRLSKNKEHFSKVLNKLRKEARSYLAVTGSEKSALPGGNRYGLSGASLQKYLKSNELI